MAALLLDTHALIWLVAGTPISVPTLLEIARAQSNKSLFVATVSAWEAGTAALKPGSAPNLLGMSAEMWFNRAIQKSGARTVSLTRRIALEAASVPAFYGSGDPGDCFLIATARVMNLILVTRDRRMLSMAKTAPRYLRTIPC